MTSPLKVESISKSFGGKAAVSKFGLELQEGEIFGLVGPDGAGKTTTLRMLVGAMDPDEGKVELAGIHVQEDPAGAREHVGYMPQSYALYGELTCRENLLFFSSLLGLGKKEREERADEVLAFVNLTEFANRRAGALSGGMYKKLAIACAIIHSPKLLVLDEPTNGVDPVSRRALWASLFHLSRQKVTILISTPYMDEVERCHRIALLMNSNIIRMGKPSELLKELEGKVFRIETSDQNETLSYLNSQFPEAISYQYGNGNHICFPKAPRPSFKTKLQNDLRKKNIRLIRSGFVPPTFEDVFMVSTEE